MASSISYRTATLDDVPALTALIPRSARILQAPFYTPRQLDGAFGTIFGVDTQLIRDATYFVAVKDDQVVGCGGWSKRQTAYGGDAGKAGSDPLRDPRTEPAMIRAFFVDPDHARQGIGRRLMELSEAGALAAGFTTIETVATLAGEPLYRAFGYTEIARIDLTLSNGERLPVVRMRKRGASRP